MRLPKAATSRLGWGKCIQVRKAPTHAEALSPTTNSPQNVRLDGSRVSVIGSSPEAPSTPADFGNAPTTDIAILPCRQSRTAHLSYSRPARRKPSMYLARSSTRISG